MINSNCSTMKINNEKSQATTYPFEKTKIKKIEIGSGFYIGGNQLYKDIFVNLFYSPYKNKNKILPSIEETKRFINTMNKHINELYIGLDCYCSVGNTFTFIEINIPGRMIL